jgi:hypothetical protein
MIFNNKNFDHVAVMYFDVKKTEWLPMPVPVLICGVQQIISCRKTMKKPLTKGQ